MSISLSESRLLVASSKIRILALLRMARAMATRWRWPPESLMPRSPTKVSYCFGNFMMKSWQLAILAAASTSSSLASMRP